MQTSFIRGAGFSPPLMKQSTIMLVFTVATVLILGRGMTLRCAVA
jgi:hypothetical protein